jgi:hypothetical protein
MVKHYGLLVDHGQNNACFDDQPYSQLFCHFRSEVRCFDGQPLYDIKHKNSRALLPNVVRWTERDHFLKKYFKIFFPARKNG